MTGGSWGIRTGSYGSLLHLQNGVSQTPVLPRRPSKILLSSSREKERSPPFIFRCRCRRRVAMLLMVVLALLVFIFGSFTVQKETAGSNMTRHIQEIDPYRVPGTPLISNLPKDEERLGDDNFSGGNSSRRNSHRLNTHPSPVVSDTTNITSYVHPMSHPCDNFAFPPPPPAYRRRIGPRPCPVCYIPVEQAIASMPSAPSVSPVLHNLTYVHDENPVETEPHGGSDFGGYPSLKERSDGFDIKESMKVHCGFVKGNTPGRQTGFDIDEADLMELKQFHEVIVASAIFGNYDIVQQPKNISEAAREKVPFYMFIDEETETYMKNFSILDSSKRVGLWKIIVVRNVPYADARRNGKVPKLLLHRIFPNVRYSIWIDGKLQLVVDPYQILERFLWRPNATFAISRHYKRFDVFEEAEANKAAGKYDNATIDHQIQFYEQYDGLTHYTRAKFPITSDVPEGCVLIREHIPITNLFTCLWFNEVDRFTSRDQLSFSTVRDKIMSKVDWIINMFLDCERRNFVIQAYHRDLLEHMPPSAPAVIRYPPAMPNNINRSQKKNPPRRGRGDRRSGSKRHRKVAIGSRDNN
ncbi:Inner membrane protein oxaA [Quillaja saponaria]|uniref:Inner membrane protein oxaA n=1 Tax=Quillaja saponaria TaxID=32244 RepID=A0AAD7VND2_QUISA|nr:Inner membrane protein oxaA [Quillaja saponaria]